MAEEWRVEMDGWRERGDRKERDGERRPAACAIFFRTLFKVVIRGLIERGVER